MSGAYNRKDHFYQKAKEEGAPSRAIYKLQELNQRYNLLKAGHKVLDLGAWPGGWLQEVQKHLGPHGRAVGIDLKQIEDIDDQRIKVVTGDVRDDWTISEATQFVGGEFDLILSDMSPKITGIREADQAQVVGLAELALWVSNRVLREDGTLIIKLFKGNECEEFVRSARPFFKKVHRSELKSTRKTSNEFYFVGVGNLKGP